MTKKFKNKKVYEQVKNVIVEVLMINPDIITPESRIREDLGADSLDIVSLIMALEVEFKGNISNNEAEKINTVEEAVEFIIKKMISRQKKR